MGNKPKLALMEIPNLEDLNKLFKMITGRDPTAEEMEATRLELEKLEDAAIDDAVIIDE